MSNVSRRQFLGGLGALGLLPFVPRLEALGAESTGPKRLVLLYTPHGTIRNNWLPGPNFDLAASPILSPLQSLRDKVAVVDGLQVWKGKEQYGAPHTKGMPLLFTGSGLKEDGDFPRKDQNGEVLYYYGWNKSLSVDQAVANHLESTGVQTPYRSLQFGVRCGHNTPGHRLIYAGSEQPLTPVDNPYLALQTYFNGNASALQVAQKNGERLSILDAIYPQLQAVSSKVGQSDTYKIQAHMDAVRDIEHSLQNAVTCEPVTVPPGLNPHEQMDIPVYADAMLKMMAQTVACDMTRVCSFQFSRGENDAFVYPWLGIHDEEHHLITHQTTGQAIDDMTNIYNWYAQQVAQFLQILDGIPEGDGTVLDNTLVVWGSEVGRGYDHSFFNMPFVLAGGGAGAIEMGRQYDFPEQPHNRLLVSICQAMGMSTTAFGELDQGQGALPFGA